MQDVRVYQFTARWRRLSRSGIFRNNLTIRGIDSRVCGRSHGGPVFKGTNWRSRIILISLHVKCILLTLCGLV